MEISDKDLRTINAGLQIATVAITYLTPMLEDALRRGEIPAAAQEELQKLIGRIRSGEAFRESHWQKPTEANS
jgi:hypothetical protein